MNVSSINVGLTGEDLISIYNDFVAIKEIKISNIDVKEDIRISGSFTKGLTINFEVKVKLNSMENGLINGELTGFKILNIGIPSFIRKTILKFALKSLSDVGINYDKGKVIIQYKYLLKDIPYVDFDIYSIYCAYGVFNVELRNAKFSLGGELKKEIELLNFEKEKVPEFNEEDISKIEDSYTKGREKIKDKLPNNAKKYSDYIFVLPDIAALIYRLLKDKRVSMKTKLVISAAVAYIAVPCDIIPDKVPFIGKIDDIAIGVFALNVIMTDVPLNVVLENWQGKNDILIVLKNVIDYATNFTGAKNIDSIYRVMEEVLSV
ncbi:YkvA family protein [Clostridium saudiense]|uniref:YkvA family protein n=1 Tax=Clostridium saudiense TaxID=1414720 RepID=UPI0018AC71F7|nr:YkvA family protein [Clostridium saudiense]